MPPIQEIIASYRAAIAGLDERAIDNLIGSYQRAYEQLQYEQDVLLREIEAMRTAGKEIGKAQLNKMRTYTRLIRDTEREMDRYAAEIGRQVRADNVTAAQMGEQMAFDLLSASTPGAIRPMLLASFQRLPREAIEALVGALQRESPLWTQTLASFGAETAQGVADGLTRAVLAGWGPRRTASEMANAWGVPLTRSMSIARTEHLRAHRTATLSGFRANRNVVRGWTWNCALKPTSCLSCVNLHGTEFGLDESFDDHPCGECFPTPLMVSWSELGYEGIDEIEHAQPGDGERWFKSLTAAEQREMMGPAKYEAWRNGKFEFSQLTQETVDEDWGRVFTERSLKRILSEV